MPRNSLPLNALLTFLAISSLFFGVADHRCAAEEPPMQEYYELRIYRTPDAAKRQAVSDYVEQALLPALARQGIDRVGVFTRTDDDTDFALYMLIPYKTLGAFSELNGKLAADTAYAEAARKY